MIGKMVTKSTVDYEQWKIDVKERYLSLFPTKKEYIQSFMDYTSEVLDPRGRSYINYKVMWYLHERGRWVKRKNQHYWIAYIGRKGGEGKSTLAKHMLWYLDSTMNSNRIAWDYEGLIKTAVVAKKKC